MKVPEPQRVTTNKVKQDLIISDGTAKCTLVLWEGQVNTLVLDHSYQLSRVIVRHYMGKHYLSVPTTGSTIEDITETEILDIESDSELSEDNEHHLIEATIVGVQQLEHNYSCMNCKKNVEPSTETTCTCSSYKRNTTPI